MRDNLNFSTKLIILNCGKFVRVCRKKRLAAGRRARKAVVLCKAARQGFTIVNQFAFTGFVIPIIASTRLVLSVERSKKKKRDSRKVEELRL